jgi:CTP:molybdopterin cytidylyltransferase MocA
MQAVVLAGGASSRFWPLNTSHKSLLTLCGKTLLEHTLDGLNANGIDDVIIVQGPDQVIETSITPPDGMRVTFTFEPHAIR